MSDVLAGIARAQGAVGALQSAFGTIVAAAAEAEERADVAEREVRELTRQLAAAQADRLDAERQVYRRGYRTGYYRGRSGREANVEGALSDGRNPLSAVA